MSSPSGVASLAHREGRRHPAHQPGDLVPADFMAGPPGGLPQLVGAVHLAVGHPQHQQGLAHPGVSQRPRRWNGLSVLGAVVGARSHLQDLADGLDSELVTVGVDERHDYFCGRSSSAEKKLEARFKISFARRSSLTSWRSALSSSASAVDVPGSSPASIPACFTQVRSDSTPHPSCSATRWIVPCSWPVSARNCRTIRTARSLNSGGYRFVDGCGFAMTPSSLPRYGASGDPRAVQFGPTTELNTRWCG